MQQYCNIGMCSNVNYEYLVIESSLIYCRNAVNLPLACAHLIKILEMILVENVKNLKLRNRQIITVQTKPDMYLHSSLNSWLLLTRNNKPKPIHKVHVSTYFSIGNRSKLLSIFKTNIETPYWQFPQTIFKQLRCLPPCLRSSLLYLPTKTPLPLIQFRTKIHINPNKHQITWERSPRASRSVCARFTSKIAHNYLINLPFWLSVSSFDNSDRQMSCLFGRSRTIGWFGYQQHNQTSFFSCSSSLLFFVFGHLKLKTVRPSDYVYIPNF